MKKVTAYQTPQGHLEREADRAFAWRLSYLSKPKDTSFGNNSKEILDFTEALWVINHRDQIIQLFAEYEQEIKGGGL
jgi:hypothetical protein